MEAKESKTPLNGETTAKEIESEIKLGKDIKNGIPPWAKWAFKSKKQRSTRRR
jgi:hypothetical protein